MSFVKINLKGVKEPEVAPEGSYDLRCVKVMDSETKKKDPMTVLTIVIEGTPEKYAPIQEFITYPNGGQYDELRQLALKRILTAFEIPYDEAGFDTDSLQGATCRELVTQEVGDDGVTRNRVKWPRIKE